MSLQWILDIFKFLGVVWEIVWNDLEFGGEFFGMKFLQDFSCVPHKENYINPLSFRCHSAVEQFSSMDRFDCLSSTATYTVRPWLRSYLRSPNMWCVNIRPGISSGNAANRLPSQCNFFFLSQLSNWHWAKHGRQQNTVTKGNSKPSRKIESVNKAFFCFELKK